MLTIAIHYLNGWSMAAADGATKQKAEWPPHPDRIFMALAAAWFETGEDPAEGTALRWLESLPNPDIDASSYCTRSLVTSYVPVNDARLGTKVPDGHELTTLKKAGLGVLPGFRSRQPRAFPMAIPQRPTVHLIWPEAQGNEHLPMLDALLSKVTCVGHSASLVWAWREKQQPDATWLPKQGQKQDLKQGLAAQHRALRLRVPSTGRLNTLKARMNRDNWIAYHDLVANIEVSKNLIKATKFPPRADWQDFPDAVFLASESEVKQHPSYPAAKDGDSNSANDLVTALVTEAGLARVRVLLDETNRDSRPILVSAHAYERKGVNAIPAALARRLAEQLDLAFEDQLIQTNVVSHTGADGYGRLARQASFDGPVEKNQSYILVDDFIGQGGTLANLRGYLMRKGGQVAGAIALTGKPYSAKLSLTQEQSDELRQQHGKTLESWWKEHFGHPVSRLTQSEARYLARSPDVERIRAKIIAAKQAGNHASSGRSLREEKNHLSQLQAELAERFPEGRPSSLRPAPAQWQTYIPVETSAEPQISGGVFDSQLLIFNVSGKRLSLPATLKLTAALRGCLLKACEVQPQPEWFCGHKANGDSSKAPHMALFPLPYVDAKHADGRIMGVGLALPRDLDPVEAGRCLEAFLIDENSGQPRQHRLFDGRWLECKIELETRELPPRNLQADTWTRASSLWASATPIVLDRYFKGKGYWQQMEENVKDACQRIGLPRPCHVSLHPVSRLNGAPRASDFPPLKRKTDGGKRFHSHAVIQFDVAVQGPVLIGAGRFRGYGLCRPLQDSLDAHQTSPDNTRDSNHD